MSNNKNNEDRMKWFLDAKIGIFIHWGIHSVAGVEASWPVMAPIMNQTVFGKQPDISEDEYFALADQFNPESFDAGEWVRMAEDAGARYMVITSKHHDGFCMFDAPGTTFKITSTAFGRDVCAELADACSRSSVKLGFYYSPPDMHHPGYRDTSRKAMYNWTGQPERPDWKSYLDYMESHLRKLLTDYGEVAVLWFDSLSNYDKYDPPRMQKVIKELSPDTVVNDRLILDYDYLTAEQFYDLGGFPVKMSEPLPMYSSGDSTFRSINTLLSIPLVSGLIKRKLKAAYQNGSVPKYIQLEPDPPAARFQPWETSLTMNQTWGYNPTDHVWKTESELIDIMKKVNTRGGNLLINVGPKPDGTIPEEEKSRLVHIGGWIRENGYVESGLNDVR